MPVQEKWRKTLLWTSLEDRSDELAGKARLAVESTLPEVETVLAKGDSTPSSYTLHDEDHSYRVAERIAEIAGSDLVAAMSPYEVALLLLGAYLHDIGMTPPIGRVRDHFAYLLSGDASGLSSEQLDALQIFLDDNWDGRTAPLAKTVPTREEISRAGRIVAAYVRERHNDWSAEWIREHLDGKALYAGWLDDLVLLCLSHHFGIDQLRHPDFNPKRVDTSAAIVHPRFCACLLRIADVLDFDPERTPAVLFSHRDVEDGSIIFWHKDHGIGFSLDGGTITIDAHPSDAVTHHAVICTVEEVERELVLCDQLAEETQFQRMIGRSEDLPHRWPLGPRVIRQIEPRGDSYEYVNGSFRPDPRRVLDLIGGVELYGDRLVTVRELLQNSFDAVREQIARERLKQRDPASEETRAALAQTHSVVLELKTEADEAVLICTDTGSGMSKEILLNRFLVGGKTANHEIRELERRCNRKGFSVGRTARFGIGALSYFLLASRLEIETRRSDLAGGNEGTGWSFTSAGLEDFGELSSNSGHERGTRVTLALKDGVIGEGFQEFAERLLNYLRYTVRRAPCQFRLEVEGTDMTLEVGPGWTKDESKVREELLFGLEESRGPRERELPIELLSTDRREQQEERSAYWDGLREEARAALGVHSTEGVLPDGLGTYRIFTGHFEVENQMSIGFLRLTEDDAGSTYLLPIDDDDVFLGPSIISSSWNGIEVFGEHFLRGDYLTREFEAANSIIEIDWTSDAAGRLAVNRNEVQLSEAAVEAVRLVVKEARGRLRHLAESAPPSRLTLLNARLAETESIEVTEPYWLISRTSTEKVRFGPLLVPLCDVESYRQWGREPELLFEKKPLVPIPALSAGGGTSRAVTWHGVDFEPTAVGIPTQAWRRPVVIWNSLVPRDRAQDTWPLRQLEFPPGWSQLVVLREVASLVWNRHHPAVYLVDRPAWDWILEQEEASPDPLAYGPELFRSKARIAAWTARTLSRANADVWNGLADRDPAFLPKVWEQLALDEDEPIRYLNYAAPGQEMHVVDTSSWTTSRHSKHIQEWLETSSDGLDDRWLLPPAQ